MIVQGSVASIPENMELNTFNVFRVGIADFPRMNDASQIRSCPNLFLQNPNWASPVNEHITNLL
jgi:hypothetical protein